MNVVTLSGLLYKPLKKIDLDNNKCVVHGELRVGNERGYDDIPFEVWNSRAKQLFSSVQQNDEVVLIGKMQSKLKKNEAGIIQDKKITLLVKNIKIVK